ncbi:hypothetical protein SAMN05216282_104102 [Cryobacterium psychrotolerans]|uniref:Uncharacterized protein n=1 Tax=Cryobacterium psychrotolerans TaxID=386301 RepID=A0A1G9AG52_9MICO|nr:hypothetical protein SAMN05216282_104102 [Cryobacterium psychrotolerans]
MTKTAQLRVAMAANTGTAFGAPNAAASIAGPLTAP